MSRSADPIAVVTFNDVPAVNNSLKYEALGPMALKNRRRYCERHQYTFIDQVPIDRSRPACWAKIPALLAALETHRWALWADSDVLIAEPSRRLEPFLDPDFDMIVQSHAEFFALLGIPLDAGLERMPINTGAFLIRSTRWSREFLATAYAQADLVTHGEVWDGIGEQEAMIRLLRARPEHRRRIRYVTGLQNHPRLYRPGELSIHFYGNHARHRIPPSECAEVVRRWGQAVARGRRLPPDRARFHWCVIQNRMPVVPIEGSDLDHYLYGPEDISASTEEQRAAAPDR